ncbi:hypothetical protein PNOK_0421200 [Pyrrhoderma noxium]|uniref:Uncharacterized protein n=1 Tax=Pyrrhoderma noxium TaxID=2282107 RepID=A0A286UID5_9AGAM|nr:hypothetical protein PNOK_0421200 [Pyrrhoderma noxium]
MGIIPNHYISVYSGTDKATQKNLTNEESTNLFIYGSPYGATPDHVKQSHSNDRHEGCKPVDNIPFFDSRKVSFGSPSHTEDYSYTSH